MILKQKFGTKGRGGVFLGEHGTNKCSTHSFQVLYELAFTHGNMEKNFDLFTATPRQFILKSSSVSDIHSSVVVVEETGDCLDLVSFVQQASENEIEVSVLLVSVSFHPLSHIL